MIIVSSIRLISIVTIRIDNSSSFPTNAAFTMLIVSTMNISMFLALAYHSCCSTVYFRW